MFYGLTFDGRFYNIIYVKQRKQTHVKGAIHRTAFSYRALKVTIII